MFISLTLVLLAFVLAASASPLVGGLGHRVALHKRRSLTKTDGWFDYHQAIKQVMRDRKYVASYLSLIFLSYSFPSFSKHRKNLINLKHNVGPENMNKVRFDERIYEHLTHAFTPGSTHPPCHQLHNFADL